MGRGGRRRHFAVRLEDAVDRALTRVRVVDAWTERGVVSDIDDTILVTWVPRPLLAAWNTFFLREHARRPVAGMSDLLWRLAGEDGWRSPSAG